MINVSYSVSEEGRCRLTMDGHAGAERNEEGHDLVCAGSSALAFTLAARIQNLVRDGRAHGPNMVFDTGHCILEATPRMDDPGVREAYGTVLAGLQLLADAHPGCIKCTTLKAEQEHL